MSAVAVGHGRRLQPPVASANPKPARMHYRIVTHEISDDDELVLAGYTVDGYVAAIGCRLRAARLSTRRCEVARSITPWASLASSRRYG